MASKSKTKRSLENRLYRICADIETAQAQASALGMSRVSDDYLADAKKYAMKAEADFQRNA